MDNIYLGKPPFVLGYEREKASNRRRKAAMCHQARFRDRRDAGRKLAHILRESVEGEAVIVGLPRGGVEVAYEVAAALRAPLDVIVARKIGAPSQPELGIGAVAPGGILLLDEGTIRHLGLSDDEIQRAAERERTEMQRRLREYRGGESMPDLSGKTAVIVDDGLATGVTALASIRAARAAGARRILLAIPVCAKSTATMMAEEVDRLVCLQQPDRFGAVGAWYDRFDQTTDAEVIELIEEARQMVAPEELSEP